MMELYGEGLRRIVDAIDRRRRGRRPHPRPARRRRRRREPDADPRPVPDRPRDAGARRRSPACGRTSSRTAATSSCSGVADGVARLASRATARGCPASAATLELAIKQAIDEAAPDLLGPRGRGHRSATPAAERPTSAERCRSSSRSDGRWERRRPPAAVPDLAAARPGRRRRTRDAAQRRRCAAPELIVANVDGTLLAYRDACPGCLAGLADAIAAAATCSPAPRAAARYDLPRQGARWDGAGAARAGAAAAPREPDVEVRGRPMTAIPPRRHGQRRGRRAAAADGATRAPWRRPRAAEVAHCDLCGTTLPDDHRHLLHVRRAPDPLRLRAVLRDARGRGRACARPARARCCLDGLRARRRPVGEVPDPDRPRLLLRQRASRAASSRSTRARPVRPSASSTSRRGTSWSRSIRCSPTSSPRSRR